MQKDNAARNQKQKTFFLDLSPEIRRAASKTFFSALFIIPKYFFEAVSRLFCEFVKRLWEILKKGEVREDAIFTL